MILAPVSTDAVLVERMGGWQVAVLVVGALVLFCDGFSTQTLSFVAPALSVAWGVAKQAMAPVFAANLGGLMIGALVVTPLADMFSRRLITIACVASFGVLSLLPMFATSLIELGVMRFVTGLALGGAMPSMIVAASEFVPPARRARFSVLVSSAFTLGFAVCALVSGWVIGAHGWRAMFLVGGLLPLALLPVLVVVVPESPVFLRRQGRTAALDALLARMHATMVAGAEAMPVGSSGSPVASLFAGGQAFITGCIWITYFCSGATLYFLANWLPLLVTSVGYTRGEVGMVNAVYQSGGIVCGFLLGALVDRFGAGALALALVGATVAVGVTGLVSGSLAGITVAGFVAGALVNGGQNALNAYTGGTLYPSHMRVTGLGWALGMLRLGGVLAGSLAAGFVIGLNLSPAHTFLIIGLPEVAGALALMAIVRSTGGGARRLQARQPGSGGAGAPRA